MKLLKSTLLDLQVDCRLQHGAMYGLLGRTQAGRCRAAVHSPGFACAATAEQRVYVPRDEASRRVVERLQGLAYEDNTSCAGFQTPELPQLRTDGVPVVHTPMYSAPLLPPRHRFPMQIFQTIHDHLIDDSVIDAGQVRTPCHVPG